MKSYILGLALIISPQSYSEAVDLSTVNFVYELGNLMSFDFSSGSNHECGTNIYQVNGPTEESANRKFTLVLSAFMTDKKLKVNTEGCNGNRMKVGWVRLIK